MPDSNQHIQAGRAAADFLQDFLVEAVELRLSETARIGPALDGLLDETVARHLDNHDMGDVLSGLHGFPRLRDRAREASAQRRESEQHEMRGDVAQVLHAGDWQAKLAFLADHLGLRGAIDELSRLLGIDETSRTRILYENLHGHGAHASHDLKVAASA